MRTKGQNEAEIRISDATGNTIRKWKSDVHLGVNRVVWNLRRDSFKRPATDPFAEFFGAGGPEVLPGDYTVTVKFRGEEASQAVRVLADETLAAGEHAFTWEGRDAQGRPMASGMYVILVRGSREAKTLKVTLLK